MNKNLIKLKRLSKTIIDNKVNEPSDIKKYLAILKNKNSNLKIKSKLINLTDVKNWRIDKKGNIFHETGQFFSIQGVRTSAAYDREVSSWDQPIFNQVHGGVLAIIAKITKNEGVKFLLRIKAEPGDVGKMKFCPTFQATTSNINQAHGGKKPLFAEYFDEEENSNIVYAKWQSEDGGRFHLKSNYNMIVEVNKDEELVIPNYFIWVTLFQIKQLLKIENFVGPHIRGIISYL